jgi:phospholipase A1/A2
MIMNYRTSSPLLTMTLLVSAVCASAQETSENHRETQEPQFSYSWEQRLISDAALAPFVLEPHEPTYVLITHLRSFNYGPYRALDPTDRFTRNELKLGFSLQTKLIDDLFGHDGDLWASYTQTSYWQVFSPSAPFRETNYNPAVRLAFLTRWELPGFTLRAVDIGIRHDSNGQAGSLSRSWNRAYADFKLTRGSLVVDVRPWIRIGDVEDNPNIEDYYGHFELQASWNHHEQLFSVTLRNPLSHHFGAELDWSPRITGRLRGLVQWYYGYGENLIDYDHKNNRIGVGLLLTDWL